MFSLFNNLRIGTKLLAALGAVLAFTVLMGAVAMVQLNSVSSYGQALAA